MAEKSTLVDKLPPVAKADSPEKPESAPAKSATTSAAPAAKQATKSSDSPAPKASDPQDETTAMTGMPDAPPPEITISGMQKVTYYSFVGDAVIWGMLGVVLFGKAFKDKTKVRFVSMATYGGLLIAIGFMFFVNSKIYYQYLVGNADEPGFALRGFAWAIFAPVIFYVISRLVNVPASDKKLYLTMFGLASGIFLFIGLSHLVSGRLEQMGLSVFPILFSASLTLLLFLTLGTGASALKGKLKRGVSTVVFVIIGGWFLYPLINLLSHLSANLTLFSLLLNGLDLIILSGLTFGLWQSMSTRTDRIMFKPSFGRAKRSSSAPFPAAAPSPAAEEPAASDAENAPAKPSFKRPKAPANVSNN